MDVSGKISTEDKKLIHNLVVECNVLTNLLRERNTILQAKAKEVMHGITPHPELYLLNTDTWEMKLKTQALDIPGRAQISPAPIAAPN